MSNFKKKGYGTLEWPLSGIRNSFRSRKKLSGMSMRGLLLSNSSLDEIHISELDLIRNLIFVYTTTNFKNVSYLRL